MYREGSAEKAQHAAFCLLALLIPFPFIYSTLAIWILVAAWLCGLDFGNRARNLARQPGLWLWIVLFFLYACSYFWSNDKGQSLFDTVSKLSFLVMPVCVGTGPALTRTRIRQILDALALGCCTAALICLCNAWARCAGTGSTACFFYHRLVQGFDANAVYMGWYVIVAVSGLLLVPGPRKPGPALRLVRTLAVLLLTFFLILLSSRLLLIIFLLITVPLYVFRLIDHRVRRWRAALLIVVITGGLAGALALTGNPISNRFREVMHRDVQVAYLDSYKDTVPHFNNVTLRLFAWRVGWENVRNHKLWAYGSGNGDEHQLQNERFISLGITPDRQQRYNIPVNNMNLHNMFMQALLGLGIPGFLLLSLIVFLPFASLRHAPCSNFFFLFHCCSALFMLQESALQTQAGIVFYCFFSAAYWNAVKNRAGEGRAIFKKGK